MNTTHATKIDRTPRSDKTVTIAGLFDTTPLAIDAMNDLLDNGYPSSAISLIANNAAGEYDGYFDESGKVIAADEVATTAGEGAAAGGGIGALLGGTGGVLMGLGLLAIPGVGPALAAGPIVAGLIGAGAGAVTGGIVGGLANSGLPKERAEHYAEGVRRGGTLLLLETEPGQHATDAQAILNSHRPVDIDKRVRVWREHGWEGYDPAAEPYTRDQIRLERDRHLERAYDSTLR